LVELTKFNDFPAYWRGLFKYNYDKINMLDMK